MKKTEVRKEILAWRDGLTKEFVTEKSKAIERRILSFPEFSERNILLYASFRNEVDTSEMIEAVKERVYLPVCDGDTMLAVKYDGTMTHNRFGILEPVGKDIAEWIDVVITPGIAFDPDGYRIGWGKGFYDRFFAKNLQALRIGVCYEEQMVPAVEHEPHDFPMDMIVTDERIYQ